MHNLYQPAAAVPLTDEQVQTLDIYKKEILAALPNSDEAVVYRASLKQSLSDAAGTRDMMIAAKLLEDFPGYLESTLAQFIKTSSMPEFNRLTVDIKGEAYLGLLTNIWRLTDVICRTLPQFALRFMMLPLLNAGDLETALTTRVNEHYYVLTTLEIKQKKGDPPLTVAESDVQVLLTIWKLIHEAAISLVNRRPASS